MKHTDKCLAEGPCNCTLEQYIKEETVRKPPIGLMPKSIHNQRRAINILEAMKRYIYANKTIPTDWINELKRLCI